LPNEAGARQPYYYETPTGEPLIESGKSYELRVSHPDYANVKATQIMPHSIPLTEIELRTEETEDEFSRASNFLKLTFNDPSGEKNYYELFATRFTTIYYTNEEGERIDTTTISSRVYFTSDEFAETSEEPNFTYQSRLIKDDIFDGQTHTYNGEFYDPSYFDVESLFPDIELEENDFFSSQNLEYERGEVTVYWRTVTEEYYRYTTSLRKNERARYDPFTEPVSVFTNFDEGIGAFGMRSELIYEVE